MQMLTDINAALLALISMQPVAQRELRVGFLLGSHVFLPRVPLLPTPWCCLPWGEMKAFVVCVR